MGPSSHLSRSLTLGVAILMFIVLTPNHAAPVQESTDNRYANEKGCYFMSKHYPSGHEIDTSEPCLNCTCVGSTLMCYLRVCPFIKPLGENCHSEMHVGDCCPKYWCPQVYPRITTEPPETASKGCYLDGRYYTEGDRLPMNPMNPCEACYCIRNTSVCTKQICELDIDGCFPQYKVGSCCPARYNCTDEAATTIPPGVQDEADYEGCLHEGKMYKDGDQVPSDVKCNQCYCMKHSVVCAVASCKAPAENCVPHETPDGQCCPEKYDCPEGSKITEDTMASMITTEEEYLNWTTTYKPFTSTLASVSESAVDEGLPSVAQAETFMTTESETIYPTTKGGVRRIDDDSVTSFGGEMSTGDIVPNATDLISGYRVPKITEIPEDLFSTVTGPRLTTARPIFYPSRPIPGEGICRYNDQTYKNREKIVSTDPCRENCVCINSVVTCDPVECVLEPPKSHSNCKVKKLPGECCPVYVCDESSSTMSTEEAEEPIRQSIDDSKITTSGIQQETVTDIMSTTQQITEQHVTITQKPEKHLNEDNATEITDKESVEKSSFDLTTVSVTDKSITTTDLLETQNETLQSDKTSASDEGDLVRDKSEQNVTSDVIVTTLQAAVESTSVLPLTTEVKPTEITTVKVEESTLKSTSEDEIRPTFSTDEKNITLTDEIKLAVSSTTKAEFSTEESPTKLITDDSLTNISQTTIAQDETKESEVPSSEKDKGTTVIVTFDTESTVLVKETTLKATVIEKGVTELLTTELPEISEEISSKTEIPTSDKTTHEQGEVITAEKTKVPFESQTNTPEKVATTKFGILSTTEDEKETLITESSIPQPPQTTYIPTGETDVEKGVSYDQSNVTTEEDAKAESESFPTEVTGRGTAEPEKSTLKEQMFTPEHKVPDTDVTTEPFISDDPGVTSKLEDSKTSSVIEFSVTEEAQKVTERKDSTQAETITQTKPSEQTSSFTSTTETYTHETETKISQKTTTSEDKISKTDDIFNDSKITEISTPKVDNTALPRVTDVKQILDTENYSSESEVTTSVSEEITKSQFTKVSSDFTRLTTTSVEQETEKSEIFTTSKTVFPGTTQFKDLTTRPADILPFDTTTMEAEISSETGKVNDLIVPEHSTSNDLFMDKFTTGIEWSSPKFSTVTSTALPTLSTKDMFMTTDTPQRFHSVDENVGKSTSVHQDPVSEITSFEGITLYELSTKTDVPTSSEVSITKENDILTTLMSEDKINVSPASQITEDSVVKAVSDLKTTDISITTESSATKISQTDVTPDITSEFSADVTVSSDASESSLKTDTTAKELTSTTGVEIEKIGVQTKVSEMQTFSTKKSTESDFFTPLSNESVEFSKSSSTISPDAKLTTVSDHEDTEETTYKVHTTKEIPFPDDFTSQKITFKSEISEGTSETSVLSTTPKMLLKDIETTEQEQITPEKTTTSELNLDIRTRLSTLTPQTITEFKFTEDLKVTAAKNMTGVTKMPDVDINLKTTQITHDVETTTLETSSVDETESSEPVSIFKQDTEFAKTTTEIESMDKIETTGLDGTASSTSETEKPLPTIFGHTETALFVTSSEKIETDLKDKTIVTVFPEATEIIGTTSGFVKKEPGLSSEILTTTEPLKVKPGETTAVGDISTSTEMNVTDKPFPAVTNESLEETSGLPISTLKTVEPSSISITISTPKESTEILDKDVISTKFSPLSESVGVTSNIMFETSLDVKKSSTESKISTLESETTTKGIYTPGSTLKDLATDVTTFSTSISEITEFNTSYISPITPSLKPDSLIRDTVSDTEIAAETTSSIPNIDGKEEERTTEITHILLTSTLSTEKLETKKHEEHELETETSTAEFVTKTSDVTLFEQTTEESTSTERRGVQGVFSTTEVSDELTASRETGIEGISETFPPSILHISTSEPTELGSEDLLKSTTKLIGSSEPTETTFTIESVKSSSLSTAKMENDAQLEEKVSESETTVVVTAMSSVKITETDKDTLKTTTEKMHEIERPETTTIKETVKSTFTAETTEISSESKQTTPWQEIEHSTILSTTFEETTTAPVKFVDEHTSPTTEISDVTSLGSTVTNEQTSPKSKMSTLPDFSLEGISSVSELSVPHERDETTTQIETTEKDVTGITTTLSSIEEHDIGEKISTTKKSSESAEKMPTIPTVKVSTISEVEDIRDKLSSTKIPIEHISTTEYFEADTASSFDAVTGKEQPTAPHERNETTTQVETKEKDGTGTTTTLRSIEELDIGEKITTTEQSSESDEKLPRIPTDKISTISEVEEKTDKLWSTKIPIEHISTTEYFEANTASSFDAVTGKEQPTAPHERNETTTQIETKEKEGTGTTTTLRSIEELDIGEKITTTEQSSESDEKLPTIPTDKISTILEVEDKTDKLSSTKIPIEHISTTEYFEANTASSFDAVTGKEQPTAPHERNETTTQVETTEKDGTGTTTTLRSIEELDIGEKITTTEQSSESDEKLPTIPTDKISTISEVEEKTDKLWSTKIPIEHISTTEYFEANTASSFDAVTGKEQPTAPHERNETTTQIETKEKDGTGTTTTLRSIEELDIGEKITTTEQSSESDEKLPTIPTDKISTILEVEDKTDKLSSTKIPIEHISTTEYFEADTASSIDAVTGKEQTTAETIYSTEISELESEPVSTKSTFGTEGVEKSATDESIKPLKTSTSYEEKDISKSEMSTMSTITELDVTSSKSSTLHEINETIITVEKDIIPDTTTLHSGVFSEGLTSQYSTDFEETTILKEETSSTLKDLERSPPTEITVTVLDAEDTSTPLDIIKETTSATTSKDLMTEATTVTEATTSKSGTTFLKDTVETERLPLVTTTEPELITITPLITDVPSIQDTEVTDRSTTTIHKEDSTLELKIELTSKLPKTTLDNETVETDSILIERLDTSTWTTGTFSSIVSTKIPIVTSTDLKQIVEISTPFTTSETKLTDTVFEIAHTITPFENVSLTETDEETKSTKTFDEQTTFSSTEEKEITTITKVSDVMEDVTTPETQPSTKRLPLTPVSTFMDKEVSSTETIERKNETESSETFSPPTIFTNKTIPEISETTAPIKEVTTDQAENSTFISSLFSEIFETTSKISTDKHISGEIESEATTESFAPDIPVKSSTVHHFTEQLPETITTEQAAVEIITEEAKTTPKTDFKDSQTNVPSSKGTDIFDETSKLSLLTTEASEDFDKTKTSETDITTQGRAESTTPILVGNITSGITLEADIGKISSEEPYRAKEPTLPDKMDISPETSTPEHIHTFSEILRTTDSVSIDQAFTTQTSDRTTKEILEFTTDKDLLDVAKSSTASVPDTTILTTLSVKTDTSTLAQTKQDVSFDTFIPTTEIKETAGTKRISTLAYEESTTAGSTDFEFSTEGVRKESTTFETIHETKVTGASTENIETKSSTEEHLYVSEKYENTTVFDSTEETEAIKFTTLDETETTFKLEGVHEKTPATSTMLLTSKPPKLDILTSVLDSKEEKPDATTEIDKFEDSKEPPEQTASVSLSPETVYTTYYATENITVMTTKKEVEEDIIESAENITLLALSGIDKFSTVTEKTTKIDTTDSFTSTKITPIPGKIEPDTFILSTIEKKIPITSDSTPSIFDEGKNTSDILEKENKTFTTELMVSKKDEILPTTKMSTTVTAITFDRSTSISTDEFESSTNKSEITSSASTDKSEEEMTHVSEKTTREFHSTVTDTSTITPTFTKYFEAESSIFTTKRDEFTTKSDLAKKSQTGIETTPETTQLGDTTEPLLSMEITTEFSRMNETVLPDEIETVSSLSSTQKTEITTAVSESITDKRLQAFLPTVMTNFTVTDKSQTAHIDTYETISTDKESTTGQDIVTTLAEATTKLLKEHSVVTEETIMMNATLATRSMVKTNTTTQSSTVLLTDTDDFVETISKASTTLIPLSSNTYHSTRVDDFTTVEATTPQQILIVPIKSDTSEEATDIGTVGTEKYKTEQTSQASVSSKDVATSFTTKGTVKSELDISTTTRYYDEVIKDADFTTLKIADIVTSSQEEHSTIPEIISRSDEKIRNISTEYKPEFSTGASDFSSTYLSDKHLISSTEEPKNETYIEGTTVTPVFRIKTEQTPKSEEFNVTSTEETLKISEIFTSKVPTTYQTDTSIKTVFKEDSTISIVTTDGVSEKTTDTLLESSQKTSQFDGTEISVITTKFTDKRTEEDQYTESTELPKYTEKSTKTTKETATFPATSISTLEITEPTILLQTSPSTEVVDGITADSEPGVLSTESKIPETSTFLKQDFIPPTISTEKTISEEEDILNIKQDCIVNGTMYRDGEAIKTVDPCEKCHCSLGEIRCFKILCKVAKEGCIPSNLSTSDCCPSSYECPEEDKTISIESKEKELTTPIPISFMFTTTPKSIASTTLFSKSGDFTPDTKQTMQDKHETTFDVRITSSIMDVEPDTTEKTKRDETVTESITTYSISETSEESSTPLETELDTVTITDEIPKKNVTIESESTASTSFTVDKKLILKDDQSSTLGDVTSGSTFMTSITEESVVPQDVFPSTVWQTSTTTEKEKVSGFTKQPTDTPTTFDTTKTTVTETPEKKEGETTTTEPSYSSSITLELESTKASGLLNESYFSTEAAIQDTKETKLSETKLFVTKSVKVTTAEITTESVLVDKEETKRVSIDEAITTPVTLSTDKERTSTIPESTKQEDIFTTKILSTEESSVITKNNVSEEVTTENLTTLMPVTMTSKHTKQDDFIRSTTELESESLSTADGDMITKEETIPTESTLITLKSLNDENATISILTSEKIFTPEVISITTEDIKSVTTESPSTTQETVLKNEFTTKTSKTLVGTTEESDSTKFRTDKLETTSENISKSVDDTTTVFDMSSVPPTDHKGIIHTETLEPKGNLTVLDKQGTTLATEMDTRLSVTRDTFTTKEETTPLSSVTDKIFEFVSTRFTGSTKTPDEFVENDNETVDKTNTDIPTFRISTEKVEESVTPFINLTQRFDIDIDKTTIDEQAIKTDVSPSVKITSETEESYKDIFSTISSILTSLKEGSISQSEEITVSTSSTETGKTTFETLKTTKSDITATQETAVSTEEIITGPSLREIIEKDFISTTLQTVPTSEGKETTTFKSQPYPTIVSTTAEFGQEVSEKYTNLSSRATRKDISYETTPVYLPKSDINDIKTTDQEIEITESKITTQYEGLNATELVSTVYISTPPSIDLFSNLFDNSTQTPITSPGTLDISFSSVSSLETSTTQEAETTSFISTSSKVVGHESESTTQKGSTTEKIEPPESVDTSDIKKADENITTEDQLRRETTIDELKLTTALQSEASTVSELVNMTEQEITTESTKLEVTGRKKEETTTLVQSEREKTSKKPTQRTDEITITTESLRDEDTPVTPKLAFTTPKIETSSKEILTTIEYLETTLIETTKKNVTEQIPILGRTLEPIETTEHLSTLRSDDKMPTTIYRQKEETTTVPEIATRKAEIPTEQVSTVSEIKNLLGISESTTSVKVETKTMETNTSQEDAAVTFKIISTTPEVEISSEEILTTKELKVTAAKDVTNESITEPVTEKVSIMSTTLEQTEKEARTEATAAIFDIKTATTTYLQRAETTIMPENTTFTGKDEIHTGKVSTVSDLAKSTEREVSTESIEKAKPILKGTESTEVSAKEVSTKSIVEAVTEKSPLTSTTLKPPEKEVETETSEQFSTFSDEEPTSTTFYRQKVETTFKPDFTSFAQKTETPTKEVSTVSELFTSSVKEAETDSVEKTILTTETTEKTTKKQEKETTTVKTDTTRDTQSAESIEPETQTSAPVKVTETIAVEVSSPFTRGETNATELTKGFKSIDTTPAFHTTPSPFMSETTTLKEEEDYLVDENTCIFEGRIYQSAEQIPRPDPCEFCFCFRGDIICLQQSCPPPLPNCQQSMIPGYCCPRYECPVYLTAKNITQFSRRKGSQPIVIQRRIDKREIEKPFKTLEVKGCEINGTFYEIGKTVTSASGPCLHCECRTDGLLHCDPQRCKPQPPLMLKMNSNFFRRR